MAQSSTQYGYQQVFVPYQTDLLALHNADPDRFPFLLESVARHPRQGRFDILFAEPQRRLTGEARFLDRLDREFGGRANRWEAGPAPFAGGWFLYLSYELAAQIEPCLSLPQPSGEPTAFAVRIPAAIVRDHQSRTAWLVVERDYGHLVEGLCARVEQAPTLEPLSDGPFVAADSLCEEPPDRYTQAVRRARQYIEAGDIFQANLSRVWTASLTSGRQALDVYRRLRSTNPAPFAAFCRWDDVALISSSPERLLGVRGGRAFTRPIAGTRPRGDGNLQDQALSEELFSNAKERAEHIMLIDLERNDLGRICAPGSVRVDEFMVRESYAHVHHIVSNVRGVLRGGVTPGKAIAAVFPGGTITGCPKVRCMEIIAELEGAERGAYTGSVGYLNHNGDMDLNILIRTIVLQGEKLTLRAGAGIVADSDAAMEVEETRAKAKGLLLALEDG